MPRFDNTTIRKATFKKNKVRSWDDDLLETLKISSSADEENKKIDKKLNNEKSLVESQLGFNRVQNELDQGSIRVQEEVKAIESGLQDDINVIKNLIQRLGGNEKKIFFYVINICSKKKSLRTGEVLGVTINNLIGSTRNSRETAIKRLVRKGLLKREMGKTGIHGTLNLSTSELIKNQALSFISEQ